MAEFIEYEPGTPSWVDVSTSDLGASGAFYSKLFGWEAEDQGADAGHYTMFRMRGLNVAGMGQRMDENQPPAWTTYVTVRDADATVAKVREAGGAVFMEPMDVLDVGRMAVLADPTGAVFALWQPRAHQGAQLANEPDTFCWNELNTRDTAAAIPFYEAVFGWTAETNQMGPMTYTEWKVDGRTVAGMMDMPPDVPAEVPAHWLVYFAVSDCDATVANATSLGATTFMPPTDIPPGRFAVLGDPQGAVFAVIKTNPME